MFKLSKTIKKNSGMSYVELIVVLTIFVIMTSIVLFNYGEFQAKVDIKNLASDIALKFVEAQKSALSGKLTANSPVDWKPAYGVYFNISPSTNFIYFADLNNANGYEAGNGETLATINITKNNSISRIDKCSNANCTSPTQIITPISVTFKRPNSGAVFTGVTISVSEYVQITIISPKTATAKIKIYPSGRVQVN